MKNNGIIRQSEFFVYTKKDREALERCMDLGYRFPEITTWIRAKKEDFALVHAEHNGRLRKYYHITRLGLRRIESFKEEWREVMSIYQFVIKEDEE